MGYGHIIYPNKGRRSVSVYDPRSVRQQHCSLQDGYTANSQSGIGYNTVSDEEREKEGKPLLTDSFNTRLKKRCNECGIRYLSSHKIRFSNCTMLLEKGVEIRDVQYAMGHTEQRMTEHYNRPNTFKAANPRISVVLTQGVTNV